MTERDVPESKHFGESAPLAQVIIPIPGLSPEHFDNEGNVTNLKMREKIKSKLQHHDRQTKPLADWEGIREKLETGERTAAFEVTASAIIVFIAGAGFEFGLRHGKDFKKVLSLLKKDN